MWRSLEEAVWKALEFVNAALHKGSRENLVLLPFFFLLICALIYFKVGH